MAKPKKPKFQPDDPVEYPADDDGRWEGGFGTIKSMSPGSGDVPFFYEVVSDDGGLLPRSFPEGELKHKKA